MRPRLRSYQMREHDDPKELIDDGLDVMMRNIVLGNDEKVVSTQLIPEQHIIDEKVPLEEQKLTV